MKKILAFVILFVSVSVFACKCNYQSFGENFAQNDFVAEIEILKTYNIDFEADDNNRFYKADIKIIKLYKGKPLESILIRGRVDNIYNPACEVEVKQGEKFLIYLNTDENFGMSSCTPKKHLDDKHINIERQALVFLIKNKIKQTNCFYFLGDHFNKFKNIKPKNEFAVYKLKINSKSKVETLSAIQNFGTSEDSKIESVIKNFVMLKDFMTEIKNEEVYLVLFFDKNDGYIISPMN